MVEPLPFRRAMSCNGVALATTQGNVRPSAERPMFKNLCKSSSLFLLFPMPPLPRFRVYLGCQSPCPCTRWRTCDCHVSAVPASFQKAGGCQDAWDIAEDKSFFSGFPFDDGHGVRHNQEKNLSHVAVVLAKMLVNHPEKEQPENLRPPGL